MTQTTQLQAPLPQEYYQDQHPTPTPTPDTHVDEVESNIRQLRATYLEQRQQEQQQPQQPTLARAPLEIIAAAFQTLTYGTMMQFAQELKSVEGTAFETVEQVAATLHSWALNHGNIDTSILKAKPAEVVEQKEPVKSSADLLPKVEPETPIAVTQDMVQPAV